MARWVRVRSRAASKVSTERSTIRRGGATTTRRRSSRSSRAPSLKQPDLDGDREDLHLPAHCEPERQQSIEHSLPLSRELLAERFVVLPPALDLFFFLPL